MTAVPLSPQCKPQAQSLLDALDGFTVAGAYTEFAEEKKGKLMPGMLADVIVLDGDIEANTCPADFNSETRTHHLRWSDDL